MEYTERTARLAELSSLRLFNKENLKFIDDLKYMEEVCDRVASVDISGEEKADKPVIKASELRQDIPAEGSSVGKIRFYAE